MTQGITINLNREEQQAVLLNTSAETYQVLIHGPDWIYDFGEVMFAEAPDGTELKELMEDDGIESHIESLEHDSWGRTPSPEEFVEAYNDCLKHPEKVEFVHIPVTSQSFGGFQLD